MTFNPLDHPIIMTYPKRVVRSAWTEHVPMAMLLIDLLRPSLCVELGAYSGTSYCAFCQAVKYLELDCRCYAIDTWQGDEHSGMYGQDVLADLRAHHDPLYSTFSQLVQSAFDDACPRFADGSIDILHIDGYHTYDAVRHDFDLWLPKMSDRGVVVLHDIAEHTGDFGVWKLWSEIEGRYPANFAFYHGHGLGIVAVGADAPKAAQELFELRGQVRSRFRALMYELGRRIDERNTSLAFERAEEENARLRAQQEQLTGISQRIAAAEKAQATHVKECFELKRHYEDLLEISRHHSRDLEAQLAGASRQLEAANREISWFESSRGVRVVKLARASREVLRVKGLGSLAKHVMLWLGGRRSHGLADIYPPISAPVLCTLTFTHILLVQTYLSLAA